MTEMVTELDVAYCIDWMVEEPSFDSGQRQVIFSSKACRQDLGLFSGYRCESGLLLKLTTHKNGWSYTSTHPCVFSACTRTNRHHYCCCWRRSLFSLVLHFNQRRSPPLRLQVSDCCTFRIIQFSSVITISVYATPCL
jgi:hypothetical protein